MVTSKKIIRHGRRVRRAAPAVAPGAAATSARAVRASLGLTQKLFARASGISERKLAELEQGDAPRPPQRQRLAELERLHRGLREVMKPAHIGAWLDTPNPAFGELKPIEVIERGEMDRLWRMIYQLESGTPD